MSFYPYNCSRISFPPIPIYNWKVPRGYGNQTLTQGGGISEGSREEVLLNYSIIPKPLESRGDMTGMADPIIAGGNGPFKNWHSGAFIFLIFSTAGYFMGTDHRVFLNPAILKGAN